MTSSLYSYHLNAPPTDPIYNETSFNSNISSCRRVLSSADFQIAQLGSHSELQSSRIQHCSQQASPVTIKNFVFSRQNAQLYTHRYVDHEILSMPRDTLQSDIISSKSFSTASSCYSARSTPLRPFLPLPTINTNGVIKVSNSHETLLSASFLQNTKGRAKPETNCYNATARGTRVAHVVPINSKEKTGLIPNSSHLTTKVASPCISRTRPSLQSLSLDSYSTHTIKTSLTSKQKVITSPSSSLYRRNIEYTTRSSWNGLPKKNKLMSFSAATHFSPSKMQIDPKSVMGSVVSSPHLSHLCYRIERVLQSAIYGAVFLAHEYASSDGTRVRKAALKVMLKAVERQHHGALQEDITAELKFHDDLKGHPNVLAFDHHWEDKDSVFIVMPFAEFEDLFEVLKKRQLPFKEDEARWLFRQLISGADFLHHRGIGFRDHSLENVLMFLDDKNELIIPKITDPGQAVRFQTDSLHRVKELPTGNLFGKSFRPPEVYQRRTYNPVKVDIFCLGWMLFFTVTKHQIFDRAVEDDEHWKLVKCSRYDELLKQRGGTALSKSLTQLIFNMLHPDPRHRPTAKECLSHPWFSELEVPIYGKTILGQFPLPHPLSFSQQLLQSSRRRHNSNNTKSTLQEAKFLARSSKQLQHNHDAGRMLHAKVEPMSQSTRHDNHNLVQNPFKTSKTIISNHLREQCQIESRGVLPLVSQSTLHKNKKTISPFSYSVKLDALQASKAATSVTSVVPSVKSASRIDEQLFPHLERCASPSFSVGHRQNEISSSVHEPKSKSLNTNKNDVRRPICEKMKTCDGERCNIACTRFPAIQATVVPHKVPYLNLLPNCGRQNVAVTDGGVPSITVCRRSRQKSNSSMNVLTPINTVSATSCPKESQTKSEEERPLSSPQGSSCLHSRASLNLSRNGKSVELSDAARPENLINSTSSLDSFPCCRTSTSGEFKGKTVSSKSRWIHGSFSYNGKNNQKATGGNRNVNEEQPVSKLKNVPWIKNIDKKTQDNLSVMRTSSPIDYVVVPQVNRLFPFKFMTGAHCSVAEERSVSEESVRNGTVCPISQSSSQLPSSSPKMKQNSSQQSMNKKKYSSPMSKSETLVGSENLVPTSIVQEIVTIVGKRKPAHSITSSVKKNLQVVISKMAEKKSENVSCPNIRISTFPSSVEHTEESASVSYREQDMIVDTRNDHPSSIGENICGGFCQTKLLQNMKRRASNTFTEAASHIEPLYINEKSSLPLLRRCSPPCYRASWIDIHRTTRPLEGHPRKTSAKEIFANDCGASDNILTGSTAEDTSQTMDLRSIWEGCSSGLDKSTSSQTLTNVKKSSIDVSAFPKGISYRCELPAKNPQENTTGIGPSKLLQLDDVFHLKPIAENTTTEKGPLIQTSLLSSHYTADISTRQEGIDDFCRPLVPMDGLSPAVVGDPPRPAVNILAQTGGLEPVAIDEHTGLGQSFKGSLSDIYHVQSGILRGNYKTRPFKQGESHEAVTMADKKPYDGLDELYSGKKNSKINREGFGAERSFNRKNLSMFSAPSPCSLEPRSVKQKSIHSQSGPYNVPFVSKRSIGRRWEAWLAPSFDNYSERHVKSPTLEKSHEWCLVDNDLIQINSSEMNSKGLLTSPRDGKARRAAPLKEGSSSLELPRSTALSNRQEVLELLNQWKKMVEESSTKCLPSSRHQTKKNQSKNLPWPDQQQSPRSMGKIKVSNIYRSTSLWLSGWSSSDLL